MSRIGKKPITVPSGVDVKLDADNVITVKGGKFTLTQQLHKDMKVNINGSEITARFTVLQEHLFQIWWTELRPVIKRLLQSAA